MYRTAYVIDIRRYDRERCGRRWSWAHHWLPKYIWSCWCLGSSGAVGKKDLNDDGSAKDVRLSNQCFQVSLVQALTFTILQFAEMRSMAEWLFHDFYQELSGTSRRQTEFRQLHVQPSGRWIPSTHCGSHSVLSTRPPKLCQPSGWWPCYIRDLLEPYRSMRRCRQIPSLELWW